MMDTPASLPITPVLSFRKPIGWLLVIGIVLAAFLDAVNSTTLSFGRLDIPGDLSTTPDELAWVDIAYLAAKITGFVIAPFVITRLTATVTLRLAIGIVVVSCIVASLTFDVDMLTTMRVLQGLGGGLVLVSGQTLLFLMFPMHRQPLIQVVFAFGAVVGPAILAPALQGWVVDSLSWQDMFVGNCLFGIVTLVVLMLGGLPGETRPVALKFDWVGLILIVVAAGTLCYVLQQGSRWNWEAEAIGKPLMVGVVAGALFVIHLRAAPRNRLMFRTGVLRYKDFAFAFIVSFVAGAALSASGFVIPSFALAVLGFTATKAGLLLLPSGLMLALALFIAGYLIQHREVSPLKLVPFGIVLFVVSMWMLSGSNSSSGSSELMGALLLRGLGLGTLFIALTIVAFTQLPKHTFSEGVALFNCGKQIGGLIGIAGLQTYIDHQSALNRTVLTSNLASGSDAISATLANIANGLASRGIDPANAAKAALAVFKSGVERQVAAISYDEAFIAVAIALLTAAPFVLAAKAIIARVVTDRD